MPDRPNIILVHADQHRHDCIGHNGDTVVKTPRLDQMVADGVNCTNAFTTVPVCTPARNSLLTSQWPTSHGYITNAGTGLRGPCRTDVKVTAKR